MTVSSSPPRSSPNFAGMRFLAEVVGLEQRLCAFCGVGGENRRIDQNEVALVEEIAASLLDFAADPQDRVLFRGAQPKMANVHQERRAVLLRRNWIVLRERDDLERFDSQLDSARCAS